MPALQAHRLRVTLLCEMHVTEHNEQSVFYFSMIHDAGDVAPWLEKIDRKACLLQKVRKTQGCFSFFSFPAFSRTLSKDREAGSCLVSSRFCSTVRCQIWSWLEVTVGGRTRTRVHEVARLRQSSLTAVARAHCQHTAQDLTLFCCAFVALPAPLALPHETFTASKEVTQRRGRRSRAWAGQTQTRHNITQRCCDKKGSWANRARNGPLVRHGPHQARKTSPGTQSRRTVRLEPGRKPKSTSHRASCLPRVGARQLLSRDCRTTRPLHEPHTAQSTETTLPPCRISTILCPAEPSSRNCSAAPRALAPAAPGHLPRVVRSGC